MKTMKKLFSFIANLQNHYHFKLDYQKVELYQGISKRNTYWHSTPEHSTHPKQSYRLRWGASDQCTISHGTYIHIVIYRIMNYKMEVYNWNQAGKNNGIISSPRKIM